MGIAACSFLPSVAQAAGPDRFDSIAGLMQQYVNSNRISGAVTLVGRHGKVVHLAAVGKANLEEDGPMTVDSMFRIMSMTKPITATAVMILADEGRLSLDDPVAKYIPSFAGGKLKNGRPANEMKIRHLLTHTSGLGGDQDCPVSLEVTAEMLAVRPLDFQPGTRWQYGPSFNVLGRIIEVASGQSYDDFLTDRIFRPLEMKDTTFFPKESQLARVPVVYGPGDRAAGEPPLVPSGRLRAANLGDPVPSPSGGLFSTAHDVFRFYQAILDGGEWNGRRILSADAVKAMISPQTGNLRTNWGRVNSWGYGWCIINQPRGASNWLSPGTYGHGGLYGTQVWVDPTRQAIFLLHIQSVGFEDSDSSTVRREFQRLAARSLEAG
jgi:CubicO group peptidase (beta-lactamase class C family)